MVKLGSAIKNQVAMGQNENDIMKRNDEYALNAFIMKDNKKNMRQAPTKIKYAKNSLLDKIISSNLNENAINKRLEEISYAAINGQRQTEGTYKPEGVQMLGQLGREKPLEAITKEMIQQYQEDEQAKPYMVDGEARQYLGATYEPQFPASFGELRPIDVNDAAINEYQQKQSDIVSEMTRVDRQIQEKNNQIAALKDEINTKRVGVVGSIANFSILRTEMGELKKLIQERKNLEKTNEQISFYLDIYKKNIEDAKRENAIINKQNREEVLKYEQSLKDANKNRLNLQQQPYESEFDYYQRLKEVEKQKFDPVLYKKYAENEATKKLKPNLDELFSDTSFKENVLKNINADDKFMINRLFDKVGKAYLDEYGYNNTRLSPKMTAEALKRILNTVKGQEISPLQAALQRNRQREIYSDTITLARDRQDLEARQTEQQIAATQLQARMRQRPQREIYSDTIALARDRQDLEERKAASIQLQARMRQRPQREIYSDAIALARDRQDLEARQAAAAEQAAAATNIQRIFRGNEGRINARNIARQAAAATKLQQAFRNKKAINTFAKLHVQKAIDAQKRKEDVASTRDIQQQRMDDIRLEKEREYLDSRDMAVLQEQAKQKLSSAFLRSKIQPVMRQVLQEEGAKQRLSSAFLRSGLQPQVRELIKKNKEKEAKRVERQYMRNQEAYLQDLERRLPVLEAWVEHHRQGQEREIAPQKELLKREMLYKPTTLIQSVLRGHKGRKQYEQDKIDRLVQLSMEAQERGQLEDPLYLSQSPEVSPGAALTALSGATTIGEQIRAGLRKPRSDLGGERGPSKKTLKKEQQRQLDTAFYETLTPDELNYFNSKKRMGGKTVTTILNEIRKQREGPKGSGFRKPPRRQVKVSPTEKKKDRLRLVIAQIKAGNTNPKLILEVNKLYKSLYDIDNAYMMLK